MRLILASGSPRRKELLAEAGYEFTVEPPDESAESVGNACLSPTELVAGLAFQKAAHIANRTAQGLILAADTVAECDGCVLGKPTDREHAMQMLKQMRGKRHMVHTGVCLWRRPSNRKSVQFETTTLEMTALADEEITQYLDSGLWQGKAGAFGYQDDIDWVRIVKGSASNVVGLPMHLVGQMLQMKWVNA
ncbi:MAG: Maf family protein [Pirellulaceae bacterium]|nr:Maf family protein [Pirellulaceae bacterium]